MAVVKRIQPFQIVEHSISVAVGQPAPRTVQTVLSDAADIIEIDTPGQSDSHMHDLAIADALVSGRPSVMVFSTLGFCVSQVCGPAKDIVDELYDEYRDQANFIYVEPYDLEKARSGQGLLLLPFLVDDWGLETEPWVLLTDNHGLVGAKFQGIASLRRWLRPLLFW